DCCWATTLRTCRGTLSTGPSPRYRSNACHLSCSNCLTAANTPNTSAGTAPRRSLQMRKQGIHFAAGLILAAGAPHTDVPHSKDNPIVSRFTGSRIVGYHEVNYDEVGLPLGPLRNSQFVKTLSATGKVTRIVYESPTGKSPAEVFANFRDSLQ